MWLIDTEAVPPRLRGKLARFGVEVRAGLYVGKTSGKARDAIWTFVCREMGTAGKAVLVYDAPTPQGFEVRTAGPNRREMVEVDGLWLARFVPPPLGGNAGESEEDCDMDGSRFED